MDTEDLPTNLSDNELFETVVQRSLDRRGFLKMGTSMAATGFLAGPLASCTSLGQGFPSLLGFKAVAACSADTLTVAEGYTARPFVPWALHCSPQVQARTGKAMAAKRRTISHAKWAKTTTACISFRSMAARATRACWSPTMNTPAWSRASTSPCLARLRVLPTAWIGSTRR